jgi:hypothetical protein
MRHRRVWAMVATLVTAGSVLGAAATATADGGGQSDLAALRQGTARYQDVAKALASGRGDLGLCVDHMGQHYADKHTIDGVVDPLDPEAMVYADDGKGHLRLVAVEWVATKQLHVMGNNDLHYNPAVDLWVLHAWIWSPNPDGMFADMNPRMGNCP